MLKSVKLYRPKLREAIGYVFKYVRLTVTDRNKYEWFMTVLLDQLRICKVGGPKHLN